MIFASMTGNTQDMADAIAQGVRQEGVELEVKEVFDASAKDLEAYDAILLGSYSWGDGELPDEFLDFYEEMEGLELSGKRAAVFGSCDSAYDHVGAAVDILNKKVTELGAVLTHEGLKIELTPSKDELETCREFGRTFALACLAT